MKKYFCVSDVHSFFWPLKEALDTAGFDLNEKDHILLVDGDLFDRGADSLAVYQFVKSLPKSRRVLIRGNHEQLFLDLLDKDEPGEVDYSNGTLRTLLDLAGKNGDDCIDDLSFDVWWDRKQHWAQSLFKRAKNSKTAKAVAKWIRSDAWVDCFELGDYIFEHCFIPLKSLSGLPMYFEYPKYAGLEIKKDWREAATETEKLESRWGHPYLLYRKGFFDEELKNGKILVCGHWNTSDFYKIDEPNHVISYEIEDQNPIYLSDHFIGLDACTAKSGRVNCLVLEKDRKVIKISYHN